MKWWLKKSKKIFETRNSNTLGHAHSKWVFIVTELFNIAVNDFNAKKSAHYSRVLVVTELVESRTQCKEAGHVPYKHSAEEFTKTVDNETEFNLSNQMVK